MNKGLSGAVLQGIVIGAVALALGFWIGDRRSESVRDQAPQNRPQAVRPVSRAAERQRPVRPAADRPAADRPAPGTEAQTEQTAVAETPVPRPATEIEYRRLERERRRRERARREESQQGSPDLRRLRKAYHDLREREETQALREARIAYERQEEFEAAAREARRHHGSRDLKSKDSKRRVSQ